MTTSVPDPSDESRIRRIYLGAFDDGERDAVAGLACELLMTASDPEAVHLVADVGGELVGHVAFSRVILERGGDLVGYILAPLGVLPGHQKKGIGSALVRDGLRELVSRKVDLVFVYGDPKYYSRFGFRGDLAGKYHPPYALKYPYGWQALALGGGKDAGGSVSLKCPGAFNKPELW